MHPELRALIEAARHGGELERLVLADWLEEFGDEHDRARARLIRLQVEAKRLWKKDRRREAIAAEVDALEEAHADAWFGWARADDWCRLFWHDEKNPCFRFYHTDGLVTGFLTSLDDVERPLSILMARPEGVWITGLVLKTRRGISKAGVAALAAFPHLSNLTSLHLKDTEIGADGAAALATSWDLRHLTDLNLDHNQIGDAGAAALAASLTLSNLTSLHLSSNQIGADGAAALAASRYLKNLTALDLSYNEIGDAGASALAASPYLSNLTDLNLHYNQIRDAGAAALAASLTLRNLTFFDLQCNLIEDAGAVALAASPHLSRLIYLQLSENHIGIVAAKQLRRRFGDKVKL